MVLVRFCGILCLYVTWRFCVRIGVYFFGWVRWGVTIALCLWSRRRRSGASGKRLCVRREHRYVPLVSTLNFWLVGTLDVPIMIGSFW